MRPAGPRRLVLATGVLVVLSAPKPVPVQLPNEEILCIPTTWAGFDTHLTATLYLPQGTGLIRWRS